MRNQGELPNWRWEALRTTLWFLPAVLIVIGTLIFIVTFKIDVAAYYHQIQLPSWLRSGSSQTGPREVLIAIAAAIAPIAASIATCRFIWDCLPVGLNPHGHGLLRSLHFTNSYIFVSAVHCVFRGSPNTILCWRRTRIPGLSRTFFC